MPPVSDYILMFTTGLLGGAHCVGMCGGFVLMYSAELRASGAYDSRARRASSHAAYNVGRVLTYSLVGGFMGLAGSFVESAGHIQGIQGLALLIAGGMMIVLGLNLLGIIGRPGWLDSASLAGKGGFGRAFRSLMARRGVLAVFGLGLLLGLIPCGLSYTMEIKAASSGGFVEGFSLMAAFGLGTVPALVGVGVFYDVIEAKLRARIYKAAAVLVLLIGIKTLLRGLAFNGWIPHGMFW
jgi:hypothetical protein